LISDEEGERERNMYRKELLLLREVITMNMSKYVEKKRRRINV
jgi:hypothetical protein